MSNAASVRSQSFALATACMLTFFFFLSAFMRVPILPLYAQQLGASPLQVGAIASSFMVLAAALGFPVGAYLDRRGRRGAILTGLVVNAAASALLPFTTDAVHVAAVYALAGASMGVNSPAIAAFVGDVSHATAMARSYGWYTTALQVGMTGAPALGGLLAAVWGYCSVFVSSAAIGVVALVVAMLWLREPPFFIGQVESSRSQVTRGRRWNLGRMVTLGWMGTFAYAFAFGVIQPFFPLYATNAGMGLGSIGALFAVQSLFNALARVPIGHLSDRLGRRIPFIVSGMFSLSLGIVACVSTSSFALQLVIFAAIGLASGTTNMAIIASLAESMPPGTRGIAMGGRSTALFTGFACSPLLAGAILTAVGYMTAFTAAAVVCTVGAITYLTMGRKTTTVRIR